MGLSKVAAACRKCPYLDTCEHKRMEAHGVLAMGAGATIAAEIIAPVMRESVTVNFGGGDMGTMYRDDYEKMIEQGLRKDHFRYLGIPGA